MRTDFLVFGSPQIEQAEIDEVVAVMKSGWLGTGPLVRRFEDDFAQYKGRQEAAAVSSCTSALHMSLIAAGIGPGDEVITTPMTFCASINAIIHTGAKPVLVDVDGESMNMDVSLIKSRITPRTRAILPVHFAGRPCEMATLMEVAEEYELVVIEDCAHAVEGKYDDQQVGTFGDFGCFSFYITKNVTTGEGGIVLAKDKDHIRRVRQLSLHGMSRDAWKRFSSEGYNHYDIVECGFKNNMTDLQAAIGIHQLARVEANWRRRREIWGRYQSAFEGGPLKLPVDVAPNVRHAYHLYTVLVDRDMAGVARDTFLEEMTKQNIGVGVHYVSAPEYHYYQERFGWKPESFPNAMLIGRQTVSLPLTAGMTDGDVDDVIEAVSRCLH